MQNM